MLKTDKEIVDGILDFLGMLEEDGILPDSRGPQVYKDTLKKERNEKEDRDFVDKESLYSLLCEYQELQEQKICRDANRKKMTPKQSSRWFELRNQLAISYMKIGKKLLNHPHFKGYPHEEKEDMLQTAMMKALAIGLEGRKNFGREYWTRFDSENRNNVFAFWTQQIKMFFYQYLNEKHKQINIKWDVLEAMVAQFDYDAKNIYGTPGATFHYGDVVDDEI